MGKFGSKFGGFGGRNFYTLKSPSISFEEGNDIYVYYGGACCKNLNLHHVLSTGCDACMSLDCDDDILIPSGNIVFRNDLFSNVPEHYIIESGVWPYALNPLAGFYIRYANMWRNPSKSNTPKAASLSYRIQIDGVTPNINYPYCTTYNDCNLINQGRLYSGGVGYTWLNSPYYSYNTSTAADWLSSRRERSEYLGTIYFNKTYGKWNHNQIMTDSEGFSPCGTWGMSFYLVLAGIDFLHPASGLFQYGTHFYDEDEFAKEPGDAFCTFNRTPMVYPLCVPGVSGVVEPDLEAHNFIKQTLWNCCFGPNYALDEQVRLTGRLSSDPLNNIEVMQSSGYCSSFDGKSPFIDAFFYNLDNNCPKPIIWMVTRVHKQQMWPPRKKLRLCRTIQVYQVPFLTKFDNEKTTHLTVDDINQYYIQVPHYPCDFPCGENWGSDYLNEFQEGDAWLCDGAGCNTCTSDTVPTTGFGAGDACEEDACRDFIYISPLASYNGDYMINGGYEKRPPLLKDVGADLYGYLANMYNALGSGIQTVQGDIIKYFDKDTILTALYFTNKFALKRRVYNRTYFNPDHPEDTIEWWLAPIQQPILGGDVDILSDCADLSEKMYEIYGGRLYGGNFNCREFDFVFHIGQQIWPPPSSEYSCFAYADGVTDPTKQEGSLDCNPDSEYNPKIWKINHPPCDFSNTLIKIKSMSNLPSGLLSVNDNTIRNTVGWSEVFKAPVYRSRTIYGVDDNHLNDVFVTIPGPEFNVTPSWAPKSCQDIMWECPTNENFLDLQYGYHYNRAVLFHNAYYYVPSQNPWQPVGTKSLDMQYMAMPPYLKNYLLLSNNNGFGPVPSFVEVEVSGMISFVRHEPSGVAIINQPLFTPHSNRCKECDECELFNGKYRLIFNRGSFPTSMCFPQYDIFNPGDEAFFLGHKDITIKTLQLNWGYSIIEDTKDAYWDDELGANKFYQILNKNGLVTQFFGEPPVMVVGSGVLPPRPALLYHRPICCECGIDEHGLCLSHIEYSIFPSGRPTSYIYTDIIPSGGSNITQQIIVPEYAFAGRVSFYSIRSELLATYDKVLDFETPPIEIDAIEDICATIYPPGSYNYIQCKAGMGRTQYINRDKYYLTLMPNPIEPCELNGIYTLTYKASGLKTLSDMPFSIPASSDVTICIIPDTVNVQLTTEKTCDEITSFGPMQNVPPGHHVPKVGCGSIFPEHPKFMQVTTPSDPWTYSVKMVDWEYNIVGQSLMVKDPAPPEVPIGGDPGGGGGEHPPEGCFTEEVEDIGTSNLFPGDACCIAISDLPEEGYYCEERPPCIDNDCFSQHYRGDDACSGILHILGVSFFQFDELEWCHGPVGGPYPRPASPNWPGNNTCEHFKDKWATIAPYTRCGWHPQYGYPQCQGACDCLDPCYFTRQPHLIAQIELTNCRNGLYNGEVSKMFVITNTCQLPFITPYYNRRTYIENEPFEDMCPDLLRIDCVKDEYIDKLCRYPGESLAKGMLRTAPHFCGMIPGGRTYILSSFRTKTYGDHPSRDMAPGHGKLCDNMDIRESRQYTVFVPILNSPGYYYAQSFCQDCIACSGDLPEYIDGLVNGNPLNDASDTPIDRCCYWVYYNDVCNMTNLRQCIRDDEIRAEYLPSCITPCSPKNMSFAYGTTSYPINQLCISDSFNTGVDCLCPEDYNKIEIWGPVPYDEPEWGIPCPVPSGDGPHTDQPPCMTPGTYSDQYGLSKYVFKLRLSTPCGILIFRSQLFDNKRFLQCYGGGKGYQDIERCFGDSFTPKFGAMGPNCYPNLHSQDIIDLEFTLHFQVKTYREEDLTCFTCHRCEAVQNQSMTIGNMGMLWNPDKKITARVLYPSDGE